MTEVGQNPVVYIDTNVFIDLLQGASDQVARLERFFDTLKTRPGAAITSDLTRAEVLGNECLAVGWEAQKLFYVGLFDLNRFIDLLPVSPDILAETGDLRRAGRQAGRQIKLPDAIHLATALTANCKFVLSSDQRLNWPPSLKFGAPSDLVLDEILAALDA